MESVWRAQLWCSHLDHFHVASLLHAAEHEFCCEIYCEWFQAEGFSHAKKLIQIPAITHTGNLIDIVVKMEWEEIQLHGYVAAVLIPFYYVFILLLHPCYFSLFCCLPITQAYFCLSSSAAELKSSRTPPFSPVKYPTLLFQLIIHWVLWKPLQWLPSQETRTGGFFMYPTELFRWRGNTEMIYTPTWCLIPVCTHAMREAVSAISSWEHAAAAFRGISQVAEAFFRFYFLLGHQTASDLGGEGCVWGFFVCFGLF